MVPLAVGRSSIASTGRLSDCRRSSRLGYAQMVETAPERRYYAEFAALPCRTHKRVDVSRVQMRPSQSVVSLQSNGGEIERAVVLSRIAASFSSLPGSMCSNFI